MPRGAVPRVSCLIGEGVVWLQSPLVLVALCSLQEVVFFGPCPFTTRLVLFLGENTS